MAWTGAKFTWYLQYHFALATLGIALCAVQLFLLCYMVSLYSEAPPEVKRGRLPYLIVSLVLTCLWTGASVLLGCSIYTILLHASPDEKDFRIGLAYAARISDTLAAQSSLLWDIAVRIADAVLLYRCYVIWFERAWVSILPLLVWLASFGIMIRMYSPIGYRSLPLQSADLSLTVALNILITLLISARLIRAQKRFSKALPLGNNKVYLGIVAVLVESAAPIAVFGIATAATAPLQDTNEVAWKLGSIFDILYSVFMILSPQLIIFRVATGRSWATRSETTVALSRDIEFMNSADDSGASTHSSA